MNVHRSDKRGRFHDIVFSHKSATTKNEKHATGGFFGIAKGAKESEDGNEEWDSDEFGNISAVGPSSPEERPHEADAGVTADNLHHIVEAYNAKIRPAPAKPSGIKGDKHNATSCP